MCPIFRSGFSGASGILVNIFTPFFSERKASAAFPLPPPLFHYACLHDAHRVSPASIRAETAAEKYLAVTRRSSTQMGIESWARIVLEIAAFNSCVSKIEEGLGNGGEGLPGDLKRECDRRWQADGFRLRQRRGKRKREIFHGLCSVVVIPCYFSGGRPSFISFVIFKYFLTLD